MQQLHDMSDNHFYLTLPSNSSEQYYGRQHPSNYTTKLDHSISLDPGQWEVGLSQLTYPRSWHNIPATVFYVLYPDRSAGGESPFQRSHLHSISAFGDSRFISARQLVRDLQHDIRERLPEADRSAVKIKFDEISHRTKITLARDFALWLEMPLAKALGLSTENGEMVDLSNWHNRTTVGILLSAGQTDDEVSIVPPYTTCVDRLIPTLYVYCDMVKPQLVGDSYVQLLRSVDVPSEGSGERIDHKFTNTHYCDLQTGSFEAININIADGMGRPIGFKHGDVLVKLHFRRKRW